MPNNPAYASVASVRRLNRQRRDHARVVCGVHLTNGR